MKFSALVLFISQIVGAFSGSLRGKTRTVKSGGGSSPLPEKLVNQFQAFKSGGTVIGKILAHPTNRRRVVLMCRNKHYLIMKESGRLVGTKNPREVKRYGKFELQSYAPGIVGIFNVRMKKFIAIDKKGKAYAKPSLSIDTLFKEAEKGRFHTYFSYRHYKETNGTRNWYIAIKKDGRLKRPSKTLAKHRSIEFLAQAFGEYKRQLYHSRWGIAPSYNHRQVQTSVRP